MSSPSLLLDRFVSASIANDARESLEDIAAALQSKDFEKHLEPSAVWNDEEVLEALLRLLVSGERQGITLDQGRPLVCQVYTELLKSRDSIRILQKPQQGRLVQALIDVTSNPDDSAYSRVSALQVMRKICDIFPSVAQTQLLDVPNGLHRLAEMIGEENEQVRNEVLLLAKVVAQWPSCAKIWVFADVCDTVINLAIQEGGLTRGNILVVDCVDLLYSLLKHDPSLVDLVWQSPVFIKKLSSMLDLRRGLEFLSPQFTAQSNDLDDILHSAGDRSISIIPRLTPGEETLLGKVMELIGVLLGPESVRKVAWAHHPALASLMWELALLSPPPPGRPYACAVPSINLQQKALHCISEFFASSETMRRHNGLDRLLYLVCTGGPSESFEAKLAISLSALHVIRQTLEDAAAKELIVHTLAPPTSDDSLASEATVVTKLLNTVVENFHSDKDLTRRKINLCGSLGALSLFMRDGTSREMLLRISTPRSVIDEMLKSLNLEDDFITLNFLRFLSEWIIDSPAVVAAILSSTQSTSLSVLFRSDGPTGILAGLFLGISMEYMDDQAAEKYGGWTRSSILSMISKRKGGITNFMSDMEHFKTLDIPWKACLLEKATFLDWYNAQVLVVRSRIIQELTGGSDDNDDEYQGVGSTALQKLVAQQAQEVLDLREALSRARNEIASNESHLKAWKRRLESAPTQLDSMLSEYATRNVQLENEVTSLRQQLDAVEGTTDRRLKEMDDLASDLRRELDQYRKREEEFISESGRLHGDLGALSTAYANLEEEFNRISSMNSVAVPPEVVDDGAIVGLQPEGEGSSQGQAGSELEALRAENAQLRHDARVADEWMQLAHLRMGEIGSQNLDLLQEVASLKEMLKDCKNSDDGTIAESEQNDFQWPHCGKKLEMKSEEIPGDSSPQAYHAETMMREIAELKNELQLARASAIASDEERRQLEVKLSSRLSTEGELVTKLVNELEAKQHELDSLRNSIETLQDEGDESKSSLGLSLENKQEPGEPDIDRAEEFVQSEHEHQDELKELRTAYFAAQEWMAKAVEHHTMLTEQVSTLESYIRELKAAKQHGIEEKTEADECNTSNQVSDELEELRVVILELERTRENQELKVHELQSHVDELVEELTRKSAEVDELRAKSVSIQRDSERCKGTNKELRLQISELMSENSLMNEQLAMLHQKSSKAAETEAALEEQNRLLSLSEGNYEQVKTELEEVKRLSAESIRQWKERASNMEEINDDLNSMLKSNARDASKKIEQSELCIRELESKVESLQVDLQGSISKDDAYRLQSNIVSLESSLKVQQQEAINDIEASNIRCAELKVELDKLRENYQAMMKEKHDIEEASRGISDELENERALNESLSMQIQTVTEELSSTKRILMKASDDAQRDLKEVQAEIDEQAQTISSYMENEKSLEKLLEDLRTEHAEAQSSFNQSLETFQARNRELEAALACARSDLKLLEVETAAAMHEQETQSKTVADENRKLSEVLQLQKATCESLERRNGTLTNEMECEHARRVAAEKTLNDAHAEIDALVQQSEEAIAQWQGLVTELETQLEKQQADAIDAIAQWEFEYEELQSRIQDIELENEQMSHIVVDSIKAHLEKQINFVRSIADEDTAVDDSGTLRFDELNQIPSVLSSIAGVHEMHLRKVFDDLKSKLSSCLDLNNHWEATLHSRDLDFVKLQQDLSDTKDDAANREILIGSLKGRCSDLESKLSSEMNRAGVLEVELKSANSELKAQRLEHDSTLEALRSKLTLYEDQLEIIARTNNELSERIVASEKDLLDAKNALAEATSLLADANAERLKIEDDMNELEKKNRDGESLLQQLEMEKFEELTSLKEQREFLESEVVRLEDELRSTSEVLQGHITDELSRRAVDIATHALRDEVELLRSRVDGGHDALVEERKARIEAENEIANLKADLAVLLRVQDTGCDEEEIKSLALKVADDVQQREIKEIDQLRKALEDVLNELDLAHAAELEASRRASMAELQASLCEQEVIAAKSDVVFITQSYEETREAEAARVATFEYRISALEEDRDVVRRFHADELESLRRELSHCSMEKDRILHSLKESEKSNAALVYSTNRELEIENFGQAENEISKLRACNSHLLLSSADEAARTERRIREAVIASVSLVEADVIVEREMRVAAEAAFENMKSQLNETSEAILVKSIGSNTHSPDSMLLQLTQAREENGRLEVENSSLRSQLDELKNAVTREIAELTDRCQRAQSLALRLEGEAKVGSEVRVESEKIHSRSCKPLSGNWIMVDDQHFKSDGVNSIEALDFIVEQTAAIEEERQLYKELLSEHDELLALLAQQNLEKASLQDALLNLGGQGVVDTAIRKAEENTMRQFGTYVRLT